MKNIKPWVKWLFKLPNPNSKGLVPVNWFWQSCWASILLTSLLIVSLEAYTNKVANLKSEVCDLKRELELSRIDAQFWEQEFKKRVNREK